MTSITEIERLLGALFTAQTAIERPITDDEDYRTKRNAWVLAWNNLHAALTDDTIQALVDEDDALNEITTRAEAAVAEMCAYFIGEHKCMENQMLCSMDCAIFMLKQAIPEARAALSRLRPTTEEGEDDRA